MSGLTYDNTSSFDRHALARVLEVTILGAGFVKTTRPGTNEDVYSRDVQGSRISVLVYTSIERGEARASGKDAIRVCAVYKTLDGKERGIASAEKRVNRVGDMEDIGNRTLLRMREVWRLACTSDRCTCGAPKFKSKNGNLVCADICWSKK